MKIRIDKERDIVRILFRHAPIEESDEVQTGVIYDYDAQGAVVGIEFLNASQTFGALNKLERPIKPKQMKLIKPRRKPATVTSRYEPVSA